MKLDNKGFAITSILYALMIMFLFVVMSMLNTLSSARKLADKNQDSITETITMNHKIDFQNNHIFSNEGDYYTTPYTGKYTIIAGGRIATVYLPTNINLVLVDNASTAKIRINNDTTKIIDFTVNDQSSNSPYIFNIYAQDSTGVAPTDMKIVSVHTKKP